MRFTHTLRVISLATIVAIAGVAAFTVPASATDPVPSPSPDPSLTIESPSPTPTTDPLASPTPAPEATPTPEPSPSPTLDPLAPAPSATTEPLATTAPLALAVVPRPNIRARIVKIALSLRHRAYRPGAIGPRAFDCSGFVRYVFRKAGVSSKLGGGHSARAMYRWGRLHHLTSRSRPRIGDVVVWGRGSHVGIYIGKGRVISALNPRQDIRVTRLHALTAPFTTFIHVRV